MKALWTFANRPLIVALVAVALAALFVRYGFNNLLGSIGDPGENARKIEALGRLELVEFNRAEDVDGDAAKFVGQIKNHSSHVLNRVQGTICFWGSEGQLMDAYSAGLEGIGTLPPGETRSFSMELRSNRNEDLDIYVPELGVSGPSGTAKVTMVFVDVGTLLIE